MLKPYSKTTPNATQGMAFVAVLVSLAVLTMLFATASSVSLSRTRDAGGVLRIAQGQVASDGLLEMARLHWSEAKFSGREELVVDHFGTEVIVSATRAHGLVDLNAARIELIRSVLRSGNIQDVEDAVEKIVAWRAGEHRMRKVSYLGYVAGLSVPEVARVVGFFTVQSGLMQPDGRRVEGNLVLLGNVAWIN